MTPFEEFWAKWLQLFKAFPKGSKPMAERAWNKLGQVERLKAERALETYALWLKGNPRMQAMHCSTYLNNARWEDFDRPAPEPPPAPKAPTLDDLLGERIARAEASLRDSPLARRAAQEGWINALTDFQVTHGRWPEDHEIDPLRDRWSQLRQDVIHTGTPPYTDYKVNFLFTLMDGILARAVARAELAGETDTPIHKAQVWFLEKTKTVRVKPVSNGKSSAPSQEGISDLLRADPIGKTCLEAARANAALAEKVKPPQSIAQGGGICHAHLRAGA